MADKNSNQAQVPKKAPPKQNQRPVQKQTAKKAAPKTKPPLTEEQRKQIEARKLAKKKQNKRIRTNILIVSFIFLTCYALISLLVVGLIYLDYNSIDAETVMPVVLYSTPKTNKEKEKALVTCPAEDVNMNGGLYIPVSALSKMTDIGTVGDSQKLTLVLRDTGDLIVCIPDSSTLQLNGTPVCLSLPVVRKNYEYYLPIELLEKYAVGVTVTAEGEGDDRFLKLRLSEYEGSVGIRNAFDVGSEQISEPEQNDTSSQNGE